MTVHFAPDWTARRAGLTPGGIAFIDAKSGRKVTFEALEARVRQIAARLRARGVAPADRVAILAKNQIRYLEVWLACHKLGAVLQNLNWRLHPREIVGLIEDAEPTIVLHDADHAGLVEAHLRDGHRCSDLRALDDPVEGEAQFEPHLARPRDPWVICYTGGSTGLPKGALLSHENLLFNAINTVVSWGLDADDVAILNAPLFHTGGLNVFTAPLLYVGGTSIVCDRFDPDQVFDLIEGGATLLFGVPTMFTLLQTHPRWAAADFSRLKLVISGGAPCPRPIFEAFFDKGVKFRTGYGLTEAGPNNFWLPDERVVSKPGCVGQPLFHVEARLIDDQGAPIDGPDEAGELLLRGPHVIEGYWRQPEATRAAIDADGWLHTGDLARRDADSDFTICGRKKDLIISGGENIHPSEVEDVLFSHPDVLEVAVLGIPDPTWGEVPVAVAVRQADLTSDALIAFAREHLARYKVPKAVHFVDALPKTGPGKIDRRALASQLVPSRK